jgi:hypothetical protein
VAEAALRQRTLQLLDAATAARAGQATTEGWNDFTHDLKKQIR